MRVQVKILVFKTDVNVWGCHYCSYCPALRYSFGRGDTIQEVVANVQSYLLKMLCYRYIYKNLQDCGWEITEHSIKIPTFADDEILHLAEQSYSTKIVEPKIIVVDVEVPNIRRFYE